MNIKENKLMRYFTELENKINMYTEYQIRINDLGQCGDYDAVYIYYINEYLNYSDEYISKLYQVCEDVLVEEGFCFEIYIDDDGLEVLFKKGGLV